MRRTGLILVGAGLLAVLLSFLLPTSVTSYSGTGAYGTMVPERVSNLALLQRQMMIFELGLAGIIAGVLLFVGGELAGRLGGGVAPAASPAAPAQRPAGGFNRRELAIGAVLVAGIVIILLFVALSGRGSDSASTGNVMAIEELNTLDEGLIEETADEAAARRREALRRAAEAQAANETAPETPAEPAPAEPAPPAETPSGNVVVPLPGNSAIGNNQ
jgi:hypothetical protein